MCVEVLSRPKASRYLNIVGSRGRIYFDGERNILWYQTVNMKEKEEILFNLTDVHKGYINPETPYIKEMKAFVEAVKNRDSSLFPNSFEKDYKILNYLYSIEKASGDESLPR